MTIAAFTINSNSSGGSAGYLIECFVIHAFCNFMGLPNLDFLQKCNINYDLKRVIQTTYVVGIGLFYCGFKYFVY